MAAPSATVSGELLSSLQIMADGWLAWQLQAEEYKKYYQPTSLSMPLTFLRPQSSTSPLYQFQHAQGEIFSFNLRPTSINGDCFFDAVNRTGFTRDALVRKLLDNPTESIRAIFGHEIRQFLYLGYTGSHPNKQESQACQQLLTLVVQKLFFTLQEVEAAFRPRVDEARLELGTRETHQKHPPELLTLLRQRNSHLVQRFEQAYQAVLNADKAIYEYCCQTDIFKRYVELYLKEARGYIPFSRDFGREIPTTTIDVINQLFGLKIQVYLPCTQGKTQLQLANQLQTGDVIPIFHNGINHFWGLNIVPKLSEASVPTVNLHQRDTSLGEQKLACEHLEINAVHMRLPEEVKSQEEVKGKSELHNLTSVESEASIKQQVTPKLEHIKAKHLLATDWQQEGANFVPMRGTWHVNSTQDFGLDEEINKFLSNDKKVLLLLGDSGAGKSLYTQGLAINLWKAYKNETPIPIWISLPSLKSPTTRAIEETFEGYGFTIEQIKYLQRTHSFVFILDAYDEMNNLSNLFVGNHLSGWKAKIIITCRREYLYHVDNYRKFFMPFQGERALYSSYTEIIVSPFNEKQVQDYFENYNKNRGTERINWQLYQQALDEIPGLKKLTTTPFILKLAIEALPSIIQQFKETEPSKRKKLTQAALYDVFIEQWFNRQEKKLKESQQIAQDENIKPEFWRYAKELAETMHKQGVTQISYEANSSDLFDPIQTSPWERFFNPTHSRLSLLRTACLIREISPNRYAFIHSSLGEYFLTRKLFEDLSSSCSSYEKKDNELSSSSTSMRAEGQERSQANTYFNQSSLVQQGSVIQFFVDRVYESESFKQSLFERIYASRNNPKGGIGATNAITILNRAGISFLDMDLSYVHIPGADLTGAMCESTNFSHGDLSRVILERAWLNHAQFTHTLMRGAELRAWPYLKLKNKVRSCAYSRDGKWLAIATGKDIELYLVATLQCVKTFTGHTSSVNSVAFSPEGKIIASGSKDKTVRLWSVESGKVLYTFTKHLTHVHSVAFSLDGKIVASSSSRDGAEDNVIHLWLVESGEVLHTLRVPLHTFDITTIAFSPDGKVVVSGNWDGIVRLWSAESGEVLRPLKGHTDLINSVAFSPDGKLVASGSGNSYGKDHTIRLWVVESGKVIHILSGHTKPVKSVAFSPDGNRVVSGSEDNTVRLWLVESGEMLRTLTGHTGVVNSVAFSPDGKVLLSGSRDATVRLWSAENGEMLHACMGHTDDVNSVAFSPDGKMAVSGSWDNMVCLWSVESGEVLHTLIGGAKHVSGVAFSPDGKMVMWGNRDGEWDKRADNTVCLWSVESGKLLRTLTGHNYPVISVACSPDGKVIASGSNDKTVRLWSVETGKVLHTLGEHVSDVYSVAFSPDGKMVASGSGIYETDLVWISDEQPVCLWSVESGKLLWTFRGHTECVTSVAFSVDGTVIASGSKDRMICLWSVENRQLLRTLAGHTNLVTSVAFSLDGRMLVSGSQDKTIRLWSVSTGKELWNLKMMFPVRSLAWQPNVRGEFCLAMGQSDGAVSVWRVPRRLSEVFTPMLLWRQAAAPAPLTAIECLLDEAQELSLSNQMLLEQHGAILSAQPQSKEVAQSVLASHQQDGNVTMHLPKVLGSDSEQKGAPLLPQYQRDSRPAVPSANGDYEKSKYTCRIS